MNGLFNEMTYFNGVPETVADILKHYDDLGGPNSYPPLRRRLGRGRRYAVHLDEAGRRQLRRHPQRHGRPLAQGHQGQGRGALAVASRHRHRADDPRSGRPARAEVGQRHAADAHRRREHGSTPSPTPRPEERHKTQYFEIFGNRGIYHDGWLAHTVHRAAWEGKPRHRARRQVGTLPRRRGLQLGERPGREEPRRSSRNCRSCS